MGATVNVTVNAVNDPPVAQDDTPSTLQNAPVTIDVRANDTDAEDAGGKPLGPNQSLHR